MEDVCRSNHTLENVRRNLPLHEKFLPHFFLTAFDMTWLEIPEIMSVLVGEEEAVVKVGVLMRRA